MSGFYQTEPDDYFTDVESAVGRQRGSRYSANPIDWATIESWKTKGVPIHIIYRVIDQADKPIKSLAYHGREVERQFEEYQSSRVGESQPEVLSDPICPFCKTPYCLKLHREIFNEEED